LSAYNSRDTVRAAVCFHNLAAVTTRLDVGRFADASSCLHLPGDWLEANLDFMSLQAQLFGNTVYSYRQQIAILLRNQKRVVDE
jgi:hypothetical protein